MDSWKSSLHKEKLDEFSTTDRGPVRYSLRTEALERTSTTTQIPIVHAFDKFQTENGTCYLTLLKEVVWPALRYKATRKGYWWMQDGAPHHCTSLAKDFIIEKFQDRVISRGTPIIWPALSPDLNPLDFHFWGWHSSKCIKNTQRPLRA